jgi:hypothetical protein
MIIVAVRAPACAMVDTDIKLTDQLLDALANRGYQGILRYTPLPGNNPKNDIDQAELEKILAHPQRFLAGFVQHPRLPGWRPSACNPEVDAQCAVRFAKAAGFPPGVHGWFDAEGMASDVEDTEAIAYYNPYCHVLVEEGFRAGGYCGYDDAMNAVDLYELHDCTSYWSDLANRKVSTRGTAIVQGAQFSLLGAQFDPDTVRLDLLGETPYFAQAA